MFLLPRTGIDVAAATSATHNVFAAVVSVAVGCCQGCGDSCNFHSAAETAATSKRTGGCRSPKVAIGALTTGEVRVVPLRSHSTVIV